ncbi:MAG: hypothetical protein IJ571_04670 [Ruminococcus sp.]|nr:hypothetical protein [Ruminococcus sp.]
MKYIKQDKRMTCLLIGFVSMLLCGVSDCLLSFMGEGGPYAVDKMVSMNISDVPLWYYQASFVIGIIAAVGYYLGASSVWSYAYDRLGAQTSRSLKAYSFGTTMMLIGIFGIHSICCLALMNVRAAVLSGVTAENIEKYFLPSSLHPFIIGTAWQTTADLISGIAFIILVCKGIINVRKEWIAVGPLCLYVICQALGTFLASVTDNSSFKHWLAGGESWGIAFMFMAVAAACRKYNKTNNGHTIIELQEETK